MMATFNNLFGGVKYTTINLCSDEEEDDDDVEFVSYTKPQQATEKNTGNCKNPKPDSFAAATLDKITVSLGDPTCEVASPEYYNDEDDFDILSLDSLDESLGEEQLYKRRDDFVDLKKHSEHKPSIHKIDCPDAVANDKVRVVDTRWNSSKLDSFAAATLDKITVSLGDPTCFPENEVASPKYYNDEDDFDIAALDSLDESPHEEQLYKRRDDFVHLKKHSKHKPSEHKTDCPDAVANDKVRVVDNREIPASNSAPDTDTLKKHTEILATANDKQSNSIEKTASQQDMEKMDCSEQELKKKGNRELRGLHSFSYNTLSDYTLNTIGGKRRSSICARLAIAEQLNDNSANDSSDERANNIPYDDDFKPTTIGKRRRTTTHEKQPKKRRKTYNSSANIRLEMNDSDTKLEKRKSLLEPLSLNVEPIEPNYVRRERRSSVCARLALAEQLKDDSPNESSIDMTVNDDVQPIKIVLRRKSIFYQLKKCKKTNNSVNIQFETYEVKKAKSLALKPQPFLKLTHLTKEEHTKNMKQMPSNVKPVENASKALNKKANYLPANANAMHQPVKYKNNDLHMTERNTRSCKLCKSKSADLTNHYIRRHKTESYISRLTLAELDNLQSNIPCGVAMAKSGNANVTKYKVKCPFCDEDIISNFNDLHWHYSTHTGEYAFQCSGCKLQKSFRVDILSHQSHSKICRNKRVQNLYLYPDNLTVIYLHCCTICNFVQLNEANVFKHLRDHHGKRSDDKECVQKYILAAIDNGASVTSNRYSQLHETHFDSLPDEGIIVSNEPILTEDTRPVEYLLKDLFSTPEKGDSFEIGPNRPNAAVENNVPVTNIISLTPMECENIKCDSNELQCQINTQAEVGKQTGVVMQAFERQEPELECGPPRTLPTTNTQNCAAVVPLISPTQPQPTPPPPIRRLHRNASNKDYRQFPKNAPNFGLFKCMANDCFYSTDVDNKILQHLRDHIDSECPPQGVLDCAYCQLDVGQCTSAENLVAHLRRNHRANRFQCSSCFYRSCVPGNVKIHQQLVHQGSEDDVCLLVYECEGLSVAVNDRLPQMMAAMLKNVNQRNCAYCSIGFFSNRFMKEHLRVHHRILKTNSKIFQQYACIYCSLNLSRKREVQEHIATKHPGELPYACERVLKKGLEVDSVHNLVVSDISLTVPPKNIKSTLTSRYPEYIRQPTTNGYTETQSDTVLPTNKPSLRETIRYNEERLKPLLVKLTYNTGVSPESLYHCPVPSCGGFFSIYTLWSRHMTSRHKCLLPICPHCPEDINLPLPDFEQHFKKHCRHLFLCFHCGESKVNEQQLRQHAAAKHPASLEFRLEKIPSNITYSYTVLIDKDLHTDRLKFLLELKKVLRRLLKQMK